MSRDLLEMRRTEREMLLQRVTKLLETDKRVVAAWLLGSLGRGEADALSDIDLWALPTNEILVQTEGFLDLAEMIVHEGIVTTKQ